MVKVNGREKTVAHGEGKREQEKKQHMVKVKRREKRAYGDDKEEREKRHVVKVKWREKNSI